MLAFNQITLSISSDFFAGSPWEPERSDDLLEARSLFLQPKAVQCFPFFLEDDGGVLLVLKLSLVFRKTREKMTNLANTHCNLSVRSDTSQRASLSCLRGYYSNMASGSGALEFGPTNYDKCYAVKTDQLRQSFFEFITD